MEQQKEGIRQEFMLLNWYLKEHLASAVRIAAFIGVFSLLCFLRNVPQDVTVYMIVLMAAVGAAGFCFHYGKYRKHHLVLALLAAEPQGKTEALPEADGLLARDYQQIITSYERQFQEEQIKMEQKYRDMMEYYTMWTHQIKTPIAAMRLLLQEEDTPLSREMQSELFLPPNRRAKQKRFRRRTGFWRGITSRSSHPTSGSFRKNRLRWSRNTAI